MSRGITPRIAAAAFAVMCFTGAQYLGDRMSIDVPDAWTAQGPAQDGLVTFTEPGGMANCNIQTVDSSDLAKLSIDEINKETAHAYSAAEYADLLGQEPSAISLVSSEIQPFADAWFHIATFRFQTTDGPEVSIRFAFYILPGRISMAGCYASSADFAKYDSLFDKTIKSFRPW
ncbi:MAG: hypothetical protein GC155_12520 [Alphaproteobacteria bacterium]|nr:hypothetical protein [Alphaproteobacteria bacterium]